MCRLFMYTLCVSDVYSPTGTAALMLNVHFILSHLVDHLSNHKKVIPSVYKFNMKESRERF